MTLPAIATLLAVLSGPKVHPGSPAPALSVKTWYKGAPVTSLAKGTYVVEFWATWCGPCIENIPHLTELAKKNPDVKVIGIGIWEEDKGGNVKAFIDKMGPKMDYHVGYSGVQDGMAKSWMAAAGQNGIPTAFIVKDGTVRWIGHPAVIDETLAKVKNGSFDLAAHRRAFEQRYVEDQEQMAIDNTMAHIERLYDKGEREAATQELDGLVKKKPKAAAPADLLSFRWLSKADPAAWSTKAKAMAETRDPKDVETLRAFALQTASTPGGADQAREAIGHALDATDRKDFTTLWYASEVYRATKDDALALDVVNAMLAGLDQSVAKDQPDMKAQLLKDKATLEKRLAEKQG